MSITFWCLVAATATFAASVPVTPNYLALENNPDYKRFIYVENDRGEVELVDLKEGNITALAEKSDVIYYLYTASNTENPYMFASTDQDLTDLAASPFSPTKHNVFIVHGWKNDHSSDLNRYLRNATLHSVDVNFFVVDWGQVAHKNYLTAKGAVVAIGEFVAQFISSIQAKYGLKGSDFSLIGHSLGAHVAGNAGAALTALTQDKVHHIIGLDPAGPLFSLGDTENRLDPGDANFVQIIHTNGLLLGFASPVGHVDYYPNGGMTQPGCGLDLAGTCAHSRSYQYLAEALTGPTHFKSKLCETFGEFVDGLCNNNLESYMGRIQIETTTHDGLFFLTTNEQSPFSQS